MVKIGEVYYIFCKKLEKRFVVIPGILVVFDGDSYYLCDCHGNIYPITLMNNQISKTDETIFIKELGKICIVVRLIVVQRNGLLYLYDEVCDQMYTFSYCYSY